MTPWPIYIDMPWKNVLQAAYESLTGSLPERKQLLAQVEGLFGQSAGSIAGTSVRSAFDLFLSTMNFPVGSEIILTAINIPDMCSIAENHGLIIIPVDIDLETLAPKEELLELAITERTVAILVAHIYGKWIPMDSVIRIAKAYNLFVLEDCAECFQGFKELGHPETDVVFFSFGLIKYYTCFGGALSVVNNKDLYTKMRDKIESYPIQSHGFFLKKLAKYALFSFLLNSTALGKTIPPLLDIARIDYMEVFIALLRGYPEQLMSQLKFQPSAALLKMMLDRLANYDEHDFEMAKEKGDFVRDHLPDRVFVPGQKTRVNNYWLFPVVVDKPKEVIKALNKEGVHAYQGATQLRTVYRTKSKTINTEGISSSQSKPEQALPIYLRTAPEMGAGISQSCRCENRFEDRISDIDKQATMHQPLSVAASGYSALHLAGPANELNQCKHPFRNLEKTNHQDILFPYNAEYLIEHVIYLPVHRDVPVWYLEKICRAMNKVMKNRPGVSIKNNQKVVFPSKL